MKTRSEIKRKTPIRAVSEKKLAAAGGKVFSTFTAKPGDKPSRSSSRSSGTKTGMPIRHSKPKRKPRSAEEFARIYGSKERVEWVQRQACVACCAIHPLMILAPRSSQNAHTVTGGKGRKADANTIVPLCASHHRAYDEHRKPFDNPEAREAMKKLAPKIDALWQAEAARLAVRAQGGDSR